MLKIAICLVVVKKTDFRKILLFAVLTYATTCLGQNLHTKVDQLGTRYAKDSLTNSHINSLFNKKISLYAYHDIDTVIKYQNEINDSLAEQQKIIDTLKVHMQIANHFAIAGIATPTVTASSTATPTATSTTASATTSTATAIPTARPTANVKDSTRTAAAKAALALSPLISSQLMAAQNKFRQYKTDSTHLSMMLQGKQKGVGLRVSIFQAIPALADDNPRNFTNYHLDLSFPLNRVHGKMRSMRHTASGNDCVQIAPRNTVWVFFRNFNTSFVGVFSNKSYGARDTTSSTDTIQNNTGKWVHKRYVNLLDLRQYTFFTATANINLGTSIGRYYTWYFDAFASLSRTNLYHNKDSLYAVNFGQYGLGITGKTTFSNSPINARLNAQIFWIDPNTNSLFWLNSQYNKMPNETTRPFSLPGLETQAYANVNFTVQYRMPGNSSPSSKASSSSAISGSTPAFVYAFFGYNSAIAFGPRHLRSANNYLTLQLGYSTDIQTILKGVSSILSPNKNNN